MPEGLLIDSPNNRQNIKTISALQGCMEDGVTVEVKAVRCDIAHNLICDIDGIQGTIFRNDCALGIDDGTTRDIAIISRVGKPVMCKVKEIEYDGGEPHIILSRAEVQKEFLRHFTSTYRAGDVVAARVTHLEPFGCFVDIGCGIISLIPIDMISISRISHPSDRFTVGQNIRAVIRGIEGGRVFLSHKELLGNWEQNAALFQAGETVSGIVRSVEDYGIFVELTPNLAGLAEPCDGACLGEVVSVYIKSILPEKMKIKLIVVDRAGECAGTTPLRYFCDESHISRFRYSPESCPKVIETVFGE